MDSDTVIVCVEGGVVQSVFRVDASGAEIDAKHETLDWDHFKADTNEAFINLSPQLREHIKMRLAEDWEWIVNQLSDVEGLVCTCADRNWRGSRHDSACQISKLYNAVPTPNVKGGV